MRNDKKETVTEQEHVVYSGATLIPFCVGSVALPISLCRGPASLTTSATLPEVPCGVKQRRRDKNSNRQGLLLKKSNDEDTHNYNTGTGRCTHIRYAYLRDGACAGQDLAYRRAQYTADISGVPSTTKDEEEMVVTSASPLYALVDHVVFKLPNSFPEPRRVLKHPPFFILDDTWAEHMVEMEIHFRPWLDISPFTVSHMVLLQRRADIPPRLLSSTFGQDKPSPIVILTPTNPVLPSSLSSTTAVVTKSPLKRRTDGRNLGHDIHSDDNNTVDDEIASTAEELVSGDQGICVNLEDLEEISVVAERRDAIRIFHPTLKVVRYLSLVRAMVQPELELPPSFCILPRRQISSLHVHVDDCNTSTDDHYHRSEKRRRADDNGSENYVRVRNVTFLPSWCFPFEAIVHAHEPKRQEGAVCAMQAVLEALRKEQAELREGIEQKISSAMNNAEELRSVIQRMQKSCALLGGSERQ